MAGLRISFTTMALHYGLDMELKFLGDILYETIEKPE